MLKLDLNLLWTVVDVLILYVPRVSFQRPMI